MLVFTCRTLLDWDYATAVNPIECTILKLDLDSPAPAVIQCNDQGLSFHSGPIRIRGVDTEFPDHALPFEEFRIGINRLADGLLQDLALCAIGNLAFSLCFRHEIAMRVRDNVIAHAALCRARSVGAVSAIGPPVSARPTLQPKIPTSARTNKTTSGLL